MASRDVTARCAICGRKPRDTDSGDCPCETDALQKTIELSEKKWVKGWMQKIHDWVTNEAVRFITSRFEELKARRLQQYQIYVGSIPYYREYRQYHGRPPLYPPYLQQLKQQLVIADRELQRGVDADWRACVLKYPEVLDYYYNQVIVEIPRTTCPPPFTLGNSAQTAFSGGSGNDRKVRRGGRASAPPAGMGFPPPPPATETGLNRRHSRRDSGSYVLSGAKKPPAPTPPINPDSGFNFFA